MTLYRTEDKKNILNHDSHIDMTVELEVHKIEHPVLDLRGWGSGEEGDPVDLPCIEYEYRYPYPCMSEYESGDSGPVDLPSGVSLSIVRAGQASKKEN